MKTISYSILLLVMFVFTISSCEKYNELFEDTNNINDSTGNVVPFDSVPNPNDTIPFDTIPFDSIPSDSIPFDTIPLDTIPVDSIYIDPGDTIIPDSSAFEIF